MRFGLALPQYDYSVPGEAPLTWPTLLGHARLAERLGLDSLWLSDHLFLDIEKYGGGPGQHGTFEPLVTLAALAAEVPRVRLGTLVICEALRPAAVAAKALATIDRISGGRVDVGLGAGWYEAEYDAVGMAFPGPRERLDRLRETLEIVRPLLNGEEVTLGGRYHQAVSARLLPPPTSQFGAAPTTGDLSARQVFVGGKGDRLLRLVAECADGWNTCWAWTPEAYNERCELLARECERIGRDPATVWRSLGLTALCGEDEADLNRRFDRWRTLAPKGVLDVSLEEWRKGRLVGTVEEVRDQVRRWEGLGVETLILGAGPLPFSVIAPDDIELMAHALGVTA